MSKKPQTPYRDTADDEPSGLFTRDDPFALFADWFAMAKDKEANDPNAMTVATIDADGLPDARIVLLKDFDAQGFVFYTNLHSAKGKQMLQNPKAALVFHWKSLRRQVRVRGNIEQVSQQEADAYFASRPRDSRIGAWASQQSAPLPSRFALEKSVAANAAKFGLGKIPRPPHWSGLRLLPTAIEFWRDRPFRLHDRLLFVRETPDKAWNSQRLYP